MIYDGGLFGTAMVALLGVSVTCFVALAGIVFLGKDTASLRVRAAAQGLAAGGYVPLAVIVADEATQSLSGAVGHALAWGFAGVLVAWVATGHAWLVHTWRRVPSPGAAQHPVVEVVAHAEPESSTETYQEAIQAAGSDAEVADVTQQSVHEIRQNTGRWLVAQLIDGTTGGRPSLGWQQFLNERGAASPIGTAYGLRLATALNLEDPRLDRKQIKRTLLAMQMDGGGWASRSSSRPHLQRPEVDAWVLPPLLGLSLKEDVRVSCVAAFERSLDPRADMAFESTTVVSICLSALVQVAPASPQVAVFAGLLAGGRRSVRRGAEPVVAWSQKLADHENDLSTASTARAVVALDRAARLARDPNPEWAGLSRAGARWLVDHADLGVAYEPVRRYDDANTDLLTVCHFTPAWVARALMATDVLVNTDAPGLRRAIVATLVFQDDGAWRLPDGTQPVWMGYQGVTVITEYALRGFPWPP